MKTKFKPLILATSLVAIGLGAAANANAAAYAVATNNVQNGFINPFVNGVSDFTNPLLVVATPSATSSSSTTLTGFTGVANSDSGATPDADVSVLGIPRTNEDVNGAGYYNLEGVSGTTNYSWGDAAVLTEQTSPDTRISARNAAETNIATEGFGTADGTNSSSTIFSMPIIAGAGCGIDLTTCYLEFSFEADPYLFASLDALAEPNPASFAKGSLAFSITLDLLDVGTVFTWAPNGAVTAGGALGGTEFADGANLNTSVQALIPGTSDEKSGAYGAGTFASFRARTGDLTPGAYTLTLRMVEKTEAKRSVPEPTSLALLGLGMAGLAGLRRRKAA